MQHSAARRARSKPIRLFARKAQRGDKHLKMKLAGELLTPPQIFPSRHTEKNGMKKRPNPIGITDSFLPVVTILHMLTHTCTPHMPHTCCILVTAFLWPLLHRLRAYLRRTVQYPRFVCLSTSSGNSQLLRIITTSTIG